MSDSQNQHDGTINAASLSGNSGLAKKLNGIVVGFIQAYEADRTDSLRNLTRQMRPVVTQILKSDDRPLISTLSTHTHMLGQMAVAKHPEEAGAWTALSRSAKAVATPVATTMDDQQANLQLVSLSQRFIDAYHAYDKHGDAKKNEGVFRDLTTLRREFAPVANEISGSNNPVQLNTLSRVSHTMHVAAAFGGAPFRVDAGAWEAQSHISSSLATHASAGQLPGEGPARPGNRIPSISESVQRLYN